jgi:hypothetical protein
MDATKVEPVLRTGCFKLDPVLKQARWDIGLHL